MQKILFFGDSITDVGRNRQDDTSLGSGYALIVSSRLGFEYPGKYEFLNRGISGDRVIDLLARIKRDVINHSPDYISILIGVNDVWHEIDLQNGVDAKRFEEYYNTILSQINEALPETRILILEPYAMHGPATDERFELFRGEVEVRARIAEKIAKKRGLTFIPLQSMLDDAAEQNGTVIYTRDGVHPTPAGHELIARAWIKGFEKTK